MEKKIVNKMVMQNAGVLLSSHPPMLNALMPNTRDAP